MKKVLPERSKSCPPFFLPRVREEALVTSVNSKKKKKADMALSRP